MVNVAVLCEGSTEQEFCNRVLARDLVRFGVNLYGTLVGKPNHKRGGIRQWQVYRQELLRMVKERPQKHMALLVDYYGMPEDWPGRIDARKLPPSHRGEWVEMEIRKNLTEALDENFHPCVQLHEFESLLFVDPQTSAESMATAVGRGLPDHQAVAAKLQEIKDQHGGNVEWINDSPQTAPSKRLLDLIPGYDKVAWGTTVASDVSLGKLRTGCPWLHRWLTRLEALGTMAED